MRNLKYKVLYADPPWPEKGLIPHPSRGKAGGAFHHYNLLTLKQICEFKLPPLADDCFLFMWVPHRKFHEAVEVMEAWGFKYTHTGLVWVKLQKDGVTPVFGMGVRFRIAHELCLLGVRGKPKQLNRNTRSVLMTKRQAHSQKPHEMYGIIERYAKGPYYELFARNTRLGWTSAGDQL